MSYLIGYLQAENGNMTRDIHALNAKIRELRGYREADAHTIEDQHYEIKQWIMHHAAEKKLRMEMMAELDKVYGVDENPFRRQAYKDPDTMRIPSGDRKGEVVTKADHIYLTRCADAFREDFSGEFKTLKNWKEMLHEKISY